MSDQADLNGAILAALPLLDNVVVFNKEGNRQVVDRDVRIAQQILIRALGGRGQTVIPDLSLPTGQPSQARIDMVRDRLPGSPFAQ